MQLDRKALNRLLALNDKQLETLILALTTQYGLDLSRFQVRPGDMVALRRAIQNASDEDLLELTRQLGGGQ
ncbi:MAG: hypothetical protein E7590_06480 [Ruminococcaceae bacterium]|nr:hypothetical protein [Oscillospiraceae bacterium]